MSIESLVGICSGTRVADCFPFTHNGVCYCQFSLIGIPTGTAGREHVVFSVTFEDGGGFTAFLDEVTGIASARSLIVVRQLADVQGGIVFGRVEMISAAVVIHEYGLVAAHGIVRTEAAQIGEFSGRGVTDGYSGAGFAVVGTFHVCPHHEFLGFWVINHLRTFQYLAGVQVVALVVLYCGKHNAFELPVQQVFG